MSADLESKIDKLIEKVDRLIGILDDTSSKRQTSQRSQRSRDRKQKLAPPSEEETLELQSQFEAMFEKWQSGDELSVERTLDEMDVEKIRRFADANNLNVTAKTPKAKVMHLVAGRFRERRQLLRPHFNRSESP